MSDIELLVKRYSWCEMSLSEFLAEGNVPTGWVEFFGREDVQRELEHISRELDKTRREQTIYPDIHQVFRAFYSTPLERVKYMLLGQDPYAHGSAVGLCFSVKPGHALNPSLRNMYKELKDEGFRPVEDGVLSHLPGQGVLMLNMTLTVEKGRPNSHQKLWTGFSHKLMQYIDEVRGEEVDWILFGSDAHQVEQSCVRRGVTHKTSHPSPLAAYKASRTAPAFFGSGVFREMLGIKW